MKIPDEIINSQDGLGTLNYQSQLYFSNVTILGMRALQYAVFQSSSDSIIVINEGSLISNCTQSESSFSLLQAEQIVLKDTKIVNTDPIYINSQLNAKLSFENVIFEWNYQEYGKPPQCMVCIFDSIGRFRNVSF